MKRVIVTILIGLMTFVYSTAQCAMCRAVLESEEGQSTAQGINDGIMFLMAIPYIIVGTIGYFIYRTFNKSKKTTTDA
jgi:ABC-type spermidine/putrescine transport system permease subunit II